MRTDRQNTMKKKVAFICVHNSCRSQIAEALGKKLAGDVFESYSAGTEIKNQINQDAVRLMKEMHNIDMEESQHSKLISDIPSPDVVILMGCNVSCPALPCSHIEDWGLDDPSGKSDEDFIRTIQTIENRIEKLKEELADSNRSDKSSGEADIAITDGTLQIRKSTPADIDTIMQIYEHARRFMAENGNPNQWGPTNWPPQALIESDITAGNSYVCTDDSGKVIGTFFYIKGKNIEPTYAEITDGAWLDDSPYAVVHRLAADCSQKGIGTHCLEWVFTQSGHVRIDTHGDNTVMQKLLTKLGYTHCGTIYVVEDNYPRLAFEKIRSRT